jgi:Domain of unknown function (DUF4397)
VDDDDTEFRVSRAPAIAQRAAAGALRRWAARLAALAGTGLVGVALIAAPATAAAASAKAASSRTGWIRCAHLSPNTPPVDVYLYSFGNPQAMMVLKHVSYGGVSTYMKVEAGQYTAAMRPAGAPASTSPVLSTNLMVHAGHAYTVAGMGPAKGLRLQVLDDRLTAPKGKSLVRVIQASLKEHLVTVRAGTDTLARDLAFAGVTRYGVSAPGTWVVHASGGTESWSGPVKLTADSIHTLVVLDSSSGLRVTDLMDAAGSSLMPNGGAATGLGGTAPGPAPSPLPWLAGLAGGLLVAASALIRLRRSRAVARHAR